MTLHEVSTLIKLCKIERSKTVVVGFQTILHVPAEKYMLVCSVFADIKKRRGAVTFEDNVCTVLNSRDVSEREHVMIKIDGMGTITMGSVTV